MRKVLIIIFFIIFVISNQSAYSKTNKNLTFNQRYLSNYFSALLSYDNQKNDDALRFFQSSKPLLKKHDQFLKEYTFSLVLDGQVSKAIKQIKLSNNEKNSNFFEAKLLILLGNMVKKNFDQVGLNLEDLEQYEEKDQIEFIIYKTIKSYYILFSERIIEENSKDLGRLDLINNAFQNCYLSSKQTDSYFINLINSEEGNYSRYLFFYLSNIIENNDYEYAKDVSSTINALSSSLLISQTKKWIEQSKYNKFNYYFSCKRENDILGEFFFLISNLYSSQEDFEKSNFYLNISNFLNPKFYFNLSLLVENYFMKENYKLARKTLDKFNQKDSIFEWYKIKRIGQIISEEKNDTESLNFLENEYKNIEKPSVKILFDMANIYKGFEKYNKAINFYSLLLSKINKESEEYAEVLYRRGSSYERIDEHQKSDDDLLKSLEISPNDPYVMNYLAYSWLERNYKIERAIAMLQRAYKQKKNDPYIIDSVGWGYYLIGDYLRAERFIKKAVQLMPNDPIVNDHYGDILWKLNRKLQAKYFWKHVLNLKKTDDEMKEKVLKKLLNGLNKV